MFTLLNQAVNYAVQYRYYDYDPTYDLAAGSFGMLFWVCCCCLIWVPFLVAAYLVYQDAVKNNIENPILWAVLTFFVPLIGILLYFLIAKNGGQNAAVSMPAAAPEAVKPVEEAKVVEEKKAEKPAK